MKLAHAKLIVVGCSLWACSFAGEGFGLQPISTVGLILSACSLYLGIASWAVRYWNVLRALTPTFSKEHARASAHAGFVEDGFDYYNRVASIIVTLSFALWVALLAFANVSLGRSESFQAVKRFCDTSKVIKRRAGNVQYFGALFGQKKLADTTLIGTRMSFTIVGTKATVPTVCELRKTSDQWQITSCRFY